MGPAWSLDILCVNLEVPPVLAAAIVRPAWALVQETKVLRVIFFAVVLVVLLVVV